MDYPVWKWVTSAELLLEAEIARLTAELAARDVNLKRVEVERGKVIDALRAELADLKHDIERQQTACSEHLEEIEQLREAIKGGIDLVEFWIERGREVNMSDERYSTWLSLGYKSNGLQKMRAALRKL